jgi:two-component system, NtrC family, response regulator PilR
LFGYLKGAFTGAAQNKRGLFETANGGTLFLDEISEMSVAMQVKLLRVLQERTVRPVGGTEEIPIDVRLIAATNKDLDLLVAEKVFREDLYYRIKVIPIEVPPLRERRERRADGKEPRESDVTQLSIHFLRKYSAAAGKNIPRIAPDSLEKLSSYDWPGNVRQLENTIERAVALETSQELQVELPSERQKARAAVAAAGGAGGADVPAEGMDMERYIADLERSIIQNALRQSDGVQTRAAELLKLSYRSFRHLLKKYDI